MNRRALSAAGIGIVGLATAGALAVASAHDPAAEPVADACAQTIGTRWPDRAAAVQWAMSEQARLPRATDASTLPPGRGVVRLSPSGVILDQIPSDYDADLVLAILTRCTQ